MGRVKRFSVSMDEALCRRFDRQVSKSLYANRSEFLRDMIRTQLVEEEWDLGGEAVGTITLVYDHHRRGLTDRLTGIQHRYHRNILASTHVHMDLDVCIEVIIVKGPSRKLREVFDLLRQQRGVLNGALSLSSTGKGLK